MYIYTHTHTHTHIYIHIHTHTHTYIYTHTHIYTIYITKSLCYIPETNNIVNQLYFNFIKIQPP